MNDILGDEASIALCESCGKSINIDSNAECEACTGVFCRKICWPNHNCGTLTDKAGRVVHLGDVLSYPEHRDVFTVIEMQGTWVKGGYAKGRRHRGSHEMPIIPRLMYLKKEINADES